MLLFFKSENLKLVYAERFCLFVMVQVKVVWNRHHITLDSIWFSSNQDNYPNHVDTKCILVSIMESWCPKSRFSEKNRVIKTGDIDWHVIRREVGFIWINVYLALWVVPKKHTKVFLFSIFSNQYVTITLRMYSLEFHEKFSNALHAYLRNKLVARHVNMYTE